MMDAGHYCVQGYNHVIMFRPLSRKHTAELKRNGIICFEDDVSNNGDVGSLKVFFAMCRCSLVY